ncbi:MBL fold metallo-hydrolase [Butyrivibrio sp. VCB2006]|uniref:MBL fold metallo-hydrolase n=1 Tax=Butyrivibrio sp. VCB2006 TaxID=1280679 RepID=UPI0004064616|nr:MBL fold metallo-hydrolase [Butyrivibrio sp. VCB2006]
MGEVAKLFYQGHASVRITTVEGKTIYVDPFAGAGYDVPGRIILRPGEELKIEK